MLFNDEDVEKPLCQLSGGERAKLAFCKMMTQNANVLIMDEPTNHLDIETREALETALKLYTGTIIFVSHDRYFINAVADRIVKICDYNFIDVGNTYESYLNSLIDLTEKPPENYNTGSKKNIKNFRTKDDRKRLVNLKEDFAKTELLITTLEEESIKLNELISSGKYSKDYKKLNELSERVEEITLQLNDLYKKWEELGISLAEIQ